MVNDEYQFISTRLIPLRFDKKIVWLVKDFFLLLKAVGSFINLEVINEVFQRANFLNGDLYHKTLYPLKNSTDVIKRTAVKLLLNSSYGKKAEKTYTNNFCYVNGRLREQKIAFNQPKSKFSGIFVVNMARCYFLKEIKKVVDKKGLVLYGDTDSLILTKHPSYYNLNIHKMEMGSWKLEGKVKRNGFYHPYQEVYFLKNKLKKYYLYHPDQRYSTLIFSGCPLEFFENLDHLTLKKLFNKDFNIRIIECKTATKTNDYGQKLIQNINFETNNLLPVSHYLENGELKSV